jgi:Cu/Ag efflux pump CusA
LWLRYFVAFVLVRFIAYGVYIYQQQKWEFIPPLNEQIYMYMPVSPYGINPTNQRFNQGGIQSVFADKANSGYYLNIDLNDAKIAEYESKYRVRNNHF